MLELSVGRQRQRPTEKQKSEHRRKMRKENGWKYRMKMKEIK
jgi:hypothetical protein